MKRLLVSDEYPHGHDLGAILEGARAEILKGSHRMTNDGNPNTRHLLGSVLDCNARVMDMLSQAGKMIEDMGLASAMHLGAPVVAPLQGADPERLRMLRR
jgi:hypothetical protein